MKPSELTDFLQFAIRTRENVLIKGKPGIGKTDIVTQACHLSKAKLIVSHPVVSDPTDYKGLPFPSIADAGTRKERKIAEFLPFGELDLLMTAETPTVFFIDDLGQAPASVQAAVMHLLLARRINGHTVSEHVTFIAATNRREDKANVQGLLEPVKSRFGTIVELEVNTDDWVKWAIEKDMPVELIAFVRFRPALLDKFEPTKDIINSPMPRTVTAVGRMQNNGLPKALEFEVFKGAAGEGFAAEYCAFLKIFRELPDIDGIILNPKQAKVPTDAGTMYALCGTLGARLNDQNIGAIMQYLQRIPTEMAVATVKDGMVRNPSIQHTKAYVTWGAENANVIL